MTALHCTISSPSCGLRQWCRIDFFLRSALNGQEMDLTIITLSYGSITLHILSTIVCPVHGATYFHMTSCAYGL